MKKQIFTIICFLFFQETINAQFTLEAQNPSTLNLKTNSTDRMVITNNGNFAFGGHTNPATKFHFQRNSVGVLPTNFPVFTTMGIFENNDAAQLYIITPNNRSASINFGDIDDISQGQLQYDHSSDAMSIYTNSVRRLYINSSGNVGIGTSLPQYDLDLISDSDNGLGVTRSGGLTPGIFGSSSGGTTSNRSATQLTNTLALFGAKGHNGVSFTSARSKIEMSATETWTNSANGSNMSFFTTENGSTTPVSRIFIGNAGSVGIGTGSPNAKLDVNGDVSLRVETISSTGNINALNRNNKSVIKLNGVGNVTLNGISGGVDGMILYLMNSTGTNLTINDENASASSDNRIVTGISASIVFSGRGGCTLVYDGDGARWRVVGYVE